MINQLDSMAFQKLGNGRLQLFGRFQSNYYVLSEHLTSRQGSSLLVIFLLGNVA